jgi:hypothetical protein
LKRLLELETIYQKQLPPEPKTYQDLEAHSLRDLFKQAEINYLQSHAKIDFWSKIEKKNLTVKEQ